MLAILVPRRWRRVRSAVSSPTSPQVVIPIIASWQQRFAPLPDPPPEDASPQVKMAYKLKTAVGKAIYGARKCTVEPVIGIIKEVLGFRQFSLRGDAGGCGRVVSGLFGFQSQALPYLILGVTRTTACLHPKRRIIANGVLPARSVDLPFPLLR